MYFQQLRGNNTLAHCCNVLCSDLIITHECSWTKKKAVLKSAGQCSVCQRRIKKAFVQSYMQCNTCRCALLLPALMFTVHCSHVHCSLISVPGSFAHVHVPCALSYSSCSALLFCAPCARRFARARHRMHLSSSLVRIPFNCKLFIALGYEETRQLTGQVRTGQARNYGPIGIALIRICFCIRISEHIIFSRLCSTLSSPFLLPLRRCLSPSLTPITTLHCLSLLAAFVPFPRLFSLRFHILYSCCSEPSSGVFSLVRSVQIQIAHSCALNLSGAHSIISHHRLRVHLECQERTMSPCKATGAGGGSWREREPSQVSAPDFLAPPTGCALDESTASSAPTGTYSYINDSCFFDHS